MESLHVARKELDQIIINFTHEIDDSILNSVLSYTDTEGKLLRRKMSYLMQHFFNHQTHHRGQITTVISQMNLDVGTTDLLENIPNE